MKIVVTGGAGFIGSHLVDRLIDLGHEVVVIDHYASERPRFPNARATEYKVAVQDPYVRAIFKKEQPDAIVHLAAHISVARSIEDPVMDANTNIIHGLSLLEVARRAGVPKIVFASSGGAIYGAHPERPTPELRDLHPLSPYGIAKQSFEYYLEHVAQEYGMTATMLRFSNVYGPRQMPDGYAGVISIFINQLLSGEPVTIFGDGSSTRDYVYVEDAVDAFVRAIEKDQPGIFNISTGKETRIKELWEALLKVHGTDHNVQQAPFRAGEVDRSVLHNERAKKHLGWQPKTRLEEGLRKTYDWFNERYS